MQQTSVESLGKLSAAMREVESALGELRGMRDPLAPYISHARRHYREMSDTKSGKRHGTESRLSWQTACERGFCGTLVEWTRLLCDSALPNGSTVSSVRFRACPASDQISNPTLRTRRQNPN
jgi:hypothetical protein